MLKRLRADHPLLYCTLAAALFLAAMAAGINLFMLLLVLLGPAAVVRPFAIEDFLLQGVHELFGLAVALVLLGRTGRLGVFTRRGSGFLDGLLVGMFPMVWLGLALSFNLAAGPGPDAALKAPWRVAVFFVTMFLISLAEEALFRGVVAGTLLEHYGPSRAGIWKACALSGLLFGAGHLVNLLSSAPLGVLIQCCVTAALGMLYAAIYFRTGNLWVLIFLHTLQDTAALIYTGLYEGGATVSEVVSSYDPSMLLSALFYLLPTVFLLRKKRLALVSAFWRLPRPEAPAA